MYYRNAQAAVVVYDVTKASSLEKAKSWVKELQRQANPNIVIALAGNKVDLVQPSSPLPSANSPSESEDEPDDATATPGEAPSPAGGEESLRQVPREEAQAYATEAGLLFFETSAKTGEGIVEIFTEIGPFAFFHSPPSPHRDCMQPGKYQSNTSWRPAVVPAETAPQPVEPVLHDKKVLSTWRKTKQRAKMLAIVEPSISKYSGELPSCRLSHDSLHEPLIYMITPPKLPLVIAFSTLIGYWTVDSTDCLSIDTCETCFTDDHYHVAE